jgi:hypothetical protein
MQQTNYIIAMARTIDPDTEKLKRQVIFVLQPSLFAEFEGKCRSQYKTVSEVLRAMILKFVMENETAKSDATTAPTRNEGD